MKKISFVQVNFQIGPKEFNAHYLPYSVGVLWSYVNQFKTVNEKYKLDAVVWKRDKISEAFKLIENSDVVGFSTYIWNKNFNYTLAKQYKEKNPKGIVIFGGPEPPVSKQDIFKTHPYIDILVKQEGELVFKNLLENLDNYENLLKIPGLIINNNGVAVDTGKPVRVEKLDEIPSPYLNGFFDNIIKDNPDVEWNVTLETDRGCPYQCTFCDWGSLTYNKVKKFNLERIFEELEWAGKIKSGFISMTNANFGIFPERDSLIADKIIEVQNKYGYPKTFSTAWAKNQKKEVVDIVKKLVDSKSGYNQGLTVSVQTMSEGVLEIIKRKNLEMNKIKEVFNLCNKYNVPMYTELILGLPGETLESWKENFYQLFNAGNHNGITVFQLQVLENTELNLLQRKLYKIQTSTVYDYIQGSDSADEILEGIQVVIGTKDMPFDRMLDSLIFTWYIMTFHINGVTSYVSQFLNKYQGISYGEFYDKFYQFLKSDEWFNKEEEDTRKYFMNWMTTGSTQHPKLNNVSVAGNNLLHRTTMNIHIENNYNYVFELLERFLRTHYTIEESLLTQLLSFQSDYVIKYRDIKNYPKVNTYDYDFLGYLDEGKTLNKKATYNFDFPEDKKTTFPRFLDNIYYQRRRNYGKALIKKIRQTKNSK